MSGWTGGQGQGVALPGGCSDSSGTGRRPGVLWAPGQVLATSTETSTGWWPCLTGGRLLGGWGHQVRFQEKRGAFPSHALRRASCSQCLPDEA